MFLRSKRLANMKGFTLVEMMTAVAILVVVMAIALPSFKEYLINAQIRQSAENIMHGLETARNAATFRNRSVRFDLAADGSGWSICSLNEVNNTCVDIVESSVFPSNQVAVTPAGAIFEFAPLGPMQLRTTTTLAIDSPAIAPDRSRDLLIRISIEGSARLCDPNAPPGNPRFC